MNAKKGTPQTLLEACENGQTAADWNVEQITSAHVLHSHIKDYLAQQFGVAFCEAVSDDELLRLKDLWAKVTGDKL